MRSLEHTIQEFEDILKKVPYARKTIWLKTRGGYKRAEDGYIQKSKPTGKSDYIVTEKYASFNDIYELPEDDCFIFVGYYKKANTIERHWVIVLTDGSAMVESTMESLKKQGIHVALCPYDSTCENVMDFVLHTDEDTTMMGEDTDSLIESLFEYIPDYPLDYSIHYMFKNRLMRLTKLCNYSMMQYCEEECEVSEMEEPNIGYSGIYVDYDTSRDEMCIRVFSSWQECTRLYKNKVYVQANNKWYDVGKYIIISPDREVEVNEDKLKDTKYANLITEVPKQYGYYKNIMDMDEHDELEGIIRKYKKSTVIKGWMKYQTMYCGDSFNEFLNYTFASNPSDMTEEEYKLAVDCLESELDYGKSKPNAPHSAGGMYKQLKSLMPKEDSDVLVKYGNMVLSIADRYNHTDRTSYTIRKYLLKMMRVLDSEDYESAFAYTDMFLYDISHRFGKYYWKKQSDNLLKPLKIYYKYLKNRNEKPVILEPLENEKIEDTIRRYKDM